MFKRPTRLFEEIIKNGRTAMVALPDFTPLQGGVPIVIDGQVIGGVGVSGAASAQQDEELALAGAATLTEHKMTPVKFIDAKFVADGFAKGSVLDDGSNGENYMVHASRREKPGMSEVHELDTDIIYVLDGTASFVTGGNSVESKMVAANEFRGTSIDGGETRQLKKGDVVIVPKGTPHWFKQVDGAFLYYVVKVR
jgi:glc operon protein GlcG